RSGIGESRVSRSRRGFRTILRAGSPEPGQGLGASFPIHQRQHVPLGVAELGQPQLVVRRSVHEVRLGNELNGPLAQRGMRGGDVWNEVINERRRVVEFGGLGDAEENGRDAALEEAIWGGAWKRNDMPRVSR